MPDRPNIVLICVDQWRWDCLSIAGHPAVETPHIDHLANRGVRFTQAHTAVASCIAARAGLLTGLSQRTHGRVGYQDGVEWRYPTTLAGEFGKGGYQTVAVGKMHVHPQRNNVGFDEVILHDGMLHFYGTGRDSDYETWVRRECGPDCGLFDHGLEANSWVARPWHLPEYTHPTYWVVSRAAEFLRRRDTTRPFFMFMSFVAPHPPFVPPQFYLDQYLRQDLPAPPVGDWVGRIPRDLATGRWDHRTQFAQLDPRAQHRAQAGYYGLITQIDHQIGRFLEYMGDHGLAENTLLVFVSDHGEMLGDHHLRHKASPYAGSIRVPLIFSCHRGNLVRPVTPRGQVVELRDIMPTLLDFAGLPIPSSVEGASLMPAIRGDNKPVRSHLHGEHTWGDLSNHYIHDGRFKYCWYSQIGLEHLFDTADDPTEMHDLIDSPSHRDIAERLRRLLVQELTGREEAFVGSDGRLIVGRPIKPTLSHVTVG
ncbi:MAG: arylsulfatase [Phycisphaerae bacterium]